MALGTEKDAALNQAFHDLRELKMDVAYPYLLELYHDFAWRSVVIDRASCHHLLFVGFPQAVLPPSY